MVQYKLNYFNFRGRGEPIRLIFAAANQKYEDNRFDFPQWPDMKAKAPFGSAPWLEIHDGNKMHVLAQSPTIVRYLARKFGLAGKNEMESAEIEMYGDQLFDLQTEVINSNTQSDEALKKKLQEKLMTQTLPHNMKLLNDRIGKNTSGLLASSGLTWADLLLIHILDFFGEHKDNIIASYAHVKALDKKVRDLPNVAAWLAKRPKTPF